MNSDQNSRSLAPLLVAMICGFVTLAFQIGCTRLLLQHFGAGTSAIASMLSTSLAGLATGAFLIARFADRFKSPLKIASLLFGLLVLGIPCFAHFHTTLANLIDNWLGHTFENLIQHQIAFCLIAVLPVNIVLGCLLPLLVKSTSKTTDTAFAGIYASETIGAMSGSIVSAFLLIPSTGITCTLDLVAASCLAAAGICAFAQTAIDRQAESVETKSAPKRTSILFLAVVVFASVSSLGMEIIWQRYFAILFGSDTHSLAIVTASFLFGISCGAFLAPKLIRAFGNDAGVYSVGLLAISASILLSTFLLASLADGRLSLWLHGAGYLSNFPVASRFLIAVVSLLPPSITMGLALPVAVAYWTPNTDSIGKSSAEIYSTAIFGNVIGVITVGFFLIPWLGLTKTVLVLSLMCTVGGLVIYFRNKLHARQPSASLTVAFLVSICAWPILAYLVSMQPIRLGVFANDKINIEFYDEGSENSVAVISSKSAPENKRMLIDGVAIGESGGGVDEKQQLLAHLPFLIRPVATDQTVLTIGLGSGILAGELVESPSVASTTCVELLQPVINAAKKFSKQNGNVLENEKFKLICADGIRYLQVSDRNFDVIISDAKSRPGHAGNVAFFTNDYYRLCERRLSDNGIFIQWVGLNTSRGAIEVILKSFCDCFEFGHVAIASPKSIFLIGSNKPLTLSAEHMNRYFAQPHVDSLKAYNWASADDIYSMYWLDQQLLATSIIGDATANSLDLPSLETFSLSSFESGSTVVKTDEQLRLLGNLMLFDNTSDDEDSRFNNGGLDGQPQAIELLAGRRASRLILDAGMAVSELPQDWLDKAAELFSQALKDLPNLNRQKSLATFYRSMADRANSRGNINREFSALDTMSELKATTAAEEFRLGEILLSLREPLKALQYLHRAVSLAPDKLPIRNEFACALLLSGRFDQAQLQFEKILQQSSDDPVARLGRTLCKIQQNPNDRTAIQTLRSLLARHPELAEKARAMGYDIGDF